MATEIRDLLQNGAGHIVELPNFDRIYRRGRVIKWRRRASITLVLGAILVGSTLAAPDLFQRATLPPATPREDHVGSPLPDGTLLPGRYTSLALGLTLTFDVGRGWHVSAKSEGRISISRGFFEYRTDPYGYLNIVRLDRVAIPGTARTRQPPNDLIAWLEDHPSLKISSSGLITFDGEDFRYLEGRITPSRTTLDETCVPLDIFQRSCIPLLGPSEPGDVLSLPERDLVRVAVGTIGGLKIAVVINANERSFANVLRHSMELLESSHVGTR